MAWRPDKCIVRGELDNTVRGRVTGRLWLLGRDEPIVLDLAGDAWADVAGARVTLTNPAPQMDAGAGDMAALQTGRVGDITVSNRRKHFTVPEEEWQQAMREGRLGEVPWVWKNAVYLEWYSDANGRVVIETTDYDVTISEHHWTADADDQAAQQLLNMEVMRSFLDGIIARPEPTPDPEGPWHPDDTTEDEWEEQLKQSDRLTDAGLEVFDKFKDDPDAHDKEAYVMGWDHILEAKATAENKADAPENEEADDDDDFDDDGLFEKHPIMEQANAYLLMVMDRFDALGIEEKEPQPKGSPADTFLRNVMQISGKLAGVLTGWRAHPMPRGMILATTRRCLHWANEALAALTELETTPPPNTTAARFTDLRPGLFALREAITEHRRGMQEKE